MRVPRLVVGCLLLVTVEVRPASAEQILFSNLGPDDSYHSSLAGFFGFEQGSEGDPDRNWSQVMSFSPSLTAALSMIELPLHFPASFTRGPMELNLYEADANMFPGRLLESFVTSEPLLPNQLTAFSSALQPRLLAGLTYFLEATTRTDSDGLWSHVLADVVPPYRGVTRVNNGPWGVFTRTSELAYRVSGDVEAAATPEPGSLILFATGAAAIARLRTRRTRSSDIVS